jgi:MFS family permease
MHKAYSLPFSGKSVADIYLNIGHFLDHFIMLIFAKAAYDAGREFGLGYDEIIIYGTFGFVLFGGMAPLAAQLADRFSRSFVMVVYHFGIGIAAVIAGFAESVWHLATAIALIGVFAAIYHPVGIAMLIKSNHKIGFRIGVNGVFGNMGVAAAPLITGVLLSFGDWRLCFTLPGLFCLVYGVVFVNALKDGNETAPAKKVRASDSFAPDWRRALAAVALSTASGGFIFGAMTFVVPRYFEISMTNITTSVVATGLLAAIVYAVASFSQIGVGWLIDRYSPKTVLLYISAGQIVFIFLAASYTDLALFAAMLVAMCFVFGQIPITDTVLSRYVPDVWRPKILSIKFLINLSIGASVLPICGTLLQAGLSMAHLFSIMSGVAVLVMLAAFILPHQIASDRRDTVASK